MSKTRLNTQTFIDRAREIYWDKYEYYEVDYTGVDNKVDIICPVHGLFSKIAKDFF